MKLPRRTFLHLAAGAGALPALSGIARAQTYPIRPVRIVVTFPPGGPNDLHARLLGEWLANRLGQPFIVETRLGGGGAIGTEVVVRSAPDGYTLLLLSGGLAINAAFYPNLSYDLVRDIAQVAAFFKSAHIMLLSPSVPAETVPEFVAYAKANPGKINFGSNGVGATGHLAGEMFKVLTGVDMLHVPYRGEAPALTDLLSGRGRQALEIEFLKGALKPWRAADERMAAVHQPRATNAASSPEIEGYYLAGRGPR